LAKWRWKLLIEGEELWKSVVVAKYGAEVLGTANLGVMQIGSLDSAWWKSICQLERGADWFVQSVRKKLGSGNNTKFWKEVCVGEQSLEQRFPRLFSISTQQNNFIREMGRWENGGWRWELLWRRNFFVWEEELVRDLEHLINHVVMSESADKWVWKPNEAD
jgi:hypothetical protein